MIPVFIGMPKCGTTLMTHYICDTKAPIKTDVHTPYEKLKISPDCYYFGFVRNPWAWYVSRYNYFRHCSAVERGVSKGADAGLGASDFIKEFPTFRDHMIWGLKEPGFSFSARYRHMFVRDNKRVDYVGKLETVDDDMDRIMSACKVQVKYSFRDYRKNVFSDNRKANRWPHGHYSNEYCLLLKNAVLRTDMELIKKYGYQFGEDY